MPSPADTKINVTIVPPNCPRTAAPNEVPASADQGSCSAPPHWCEDLVMPYQLTFFRRSEEENGSSALAAFLSKLTETGDPVLNGRQLLHLLSSPGPS
jgi:hypothetical protein